MIYILGGNINALLDRRLKTIGVQEFTHIALTTVSIEPKELRKSALNIRSHLPSFVVLLTLGSIADKLASYAFLDHFRLLPTKIKDTIQVERNLKECQQFIERKYGYVSSTNDPTRFSS